MRPLCRPLALAVCLGWCAVGWALCPGVSFQADANSNYKPPALDPRILETADIKDDVVQRFNDYNHKLGVKKGLLWMFSGGVGDSLIGMDVKLIGLAAGASFGPPGLLLASSLFVIDEIDRAIKSGGGTSSYDEILPTDYGLQWSGELDSTTDIWKRIWKCGKWQVLKFLDNSKLQDEFCEGRRQYVFEQKSQYPTNRFQCTDWDFSGMEHGQDVDLDTQCGAWCEDAIADNVGYCNLLVGQDVEKLSAFRCGTGACCKAGVDLLGCRGAYANTMSRPETEDVSTWNSGGFGHSYSEVTTVPYESKFRCTPALKLMLCECAPQPQRHFISAESIAIPWAQCGAGFEMTTPGSDSSPGACTACPDGKFKDSADTATKEDSCENCPAGTYSNSFNTKSYCKGCEEGKYQSEAGQSSCQACEECSAAVDFEVSPCNGERQTSGDCVCIAGYYRKADEQCHPVPTNFYKADIGDRGVKPCPQLNGLPLQTVGEGSTSVEQCVCPRNKYHAGAFCSSCPPQTPWRRLEWADEKASCRGCELWEYWNGVDCVHLSRMRVVSEDMTFGVTGQDMTRRVGWRAMGTPETLLPGRYLYVVDATSGGAAEQNNTARECASCSEFAERQGCGSTAEYPMWLKFEYAGSVFEQALHKELGANDDEFRFWAGQETEGFPGVRNVSIIREGRCVSCVQCGSGRYQAGCAMRGTCLSCEPDQACAAAEYKKHPTIAAEYRDGEWVGACEQAPNVAQAPYECTPCPRWRERGGVYELLLGCGRDSKYARWDPTRVSGGQLVALECTYGNVDEGGSDPLCVLPNEQQQPNTSDVVASTHAIPYCAPGWYVDVDAEACGLAAGGEAVDETQAWTAACCRRCGDAAQAQKIRAAEYKRCSGDSGHDTELYVDRCENNYFRRHKDGSEECALCTTCGA